MSTNHNLFEEEGEPKRSRAEALLLTGPKPLPLGQTGSLLLQDNSTRTKYAGRGLSSAERPSAKLQALVYNTLPSRRKVPESGARSVALWMQTKLSSPRQELWTRQDSSICRAEQTVLVVTKDKESKTDCPCSYERQGE